jgi:predicted GNAT family N-acyltransferase
MSCKPGNHGCPNFSLTVADWQRDRDALRWLRRKIFIEEQSVPEELEWDNQDGEALHLLASDANGNPIGTGRLMRAGQIGRMGVLPEWRGRGVGGALLQRILQLAEEQGTAPLFLHAQITAIPFYEKHGFVATGEIFLEAGIEHRVMHLAGNKRFEA